MAVAKVDASLVPDSYNFSWKYTMEIKSPNSSYFEMSKPTDKPLIDVG